jgi:acyl-CoA reductase-like NAD-dependent aldehyde dehydrogenase
MPTVQTVNPFTGEPIREWEQLDFSELAEAMARSRAGFVNWRQVPIAERVERVRGALDYFEANREEIAGDITAQMGRPLAQARGEVDGLLERFNFLCDIAPEVLGADGIAVEAGKENYHREILHEPHGVVLIIAAWNYPLLVAASGVAAALLAGNTVLLKHSTRTLSIGEHFEKAFGADGLLQHVVMDHANTARLIEEGDINHVVFTGSVGGGEKIYASTAKRFFDCNLELGGKDGAYGSADADIGQSAAMLVDGAMFNAGQCCCGIERVYVHEAVYDEFLAACQPLVESYTLGDPLDAATTQGPLAVASSAKLMETQIAEAVAADGQVLAGGRARQIGQGTFFEPTLLTVNRNDLAIMQEENFGPLLPVMKVADDAEAIGHLNDSDFGLTAVICTSDRERAEAFAGAVEAGTIFMNRCDYLDPALPWTGVKASGKGSSLSRYGLLAMTRLKAIHFRTRFLT